MMILGFAHRLRCRNSQDSLHVEDNTHSYTLLLLARCWGWKSLLALGKHQMSSARLFPGSGTQKKLSQTRHLLSLPALQWIFFPAPLWSPLKPCKPHLHVHILWQAINSLITFCVQNHLLFETASCQLYSCYTPALHWPPQISLCPFDPPPLKALVQSWGTAKG